MIIAVWLIAAGALAVRSLAASGRHALLTVDPAQVGAALLSLLVTLLRSNRALPVPRGSAQPG